MLMVIIVITGNFLGMSVTTDNVRPSAKPNQWQIGKLTLARSQALGTCFLGFCTGAPLVGQCRLRLDIGALQTFAMVALVFGWRSQAVPGSRTPNICGNPFPAQRFAASQCTRCQFPFSLLPFRLP
jgi:hypothetical protein